MSHLPSQGLLEDVCVRFILTLPASELESFERLLFSIEQAWWHYEDHVREKPENAGLKTLTLKEFTGLIFECVPGLAPFRGALEEIYASFNAYKRTVPVRGAILLTPDLTKCLLVRGYKKDAGWGFPRGKLSKGETDAECAAREVLEETGFDVAGLISEKDFIDAQLGDQDTRLFIVPDVPESTHFAPHVRYEIGAFGWHLVSELPSNWDESKQAFVNEQGGRHRFFNVWPYIRPLRAWIKRRKKGGGRSAAPTPQPTAAGAAAALAALTAADVEAAASPAPAPSSSSKQRSAVLTVTRPAAGKPAAAVKPAAVKPAAARPAAAAAAAAAAGGTPGRALREFRFDKGPILEALRSA